MIGKRIAVLRTIPKFDLVVIILAVVLCVLPLLFSSVRSFYENLLPSATFAIIFIALTIAVRNYRQTVGSQFVVNYKTIKYDCLNISDMAATKMPYIKYLYIRNEKNRFEVIHRILLQVDEKMAIEVADHKYAPLLIEPFGHATRLLQPVSYYTSKSKEKHIPFVIGEGDKGKDFLVNRKNRIIVQTQDGVSFVSPNLPLGDSKLKRLSLLTRHAELEKLDIFLRHSKLDKYGTTLADSVRVVWSCEFKQRPEDIGEDYIRNALLRNKILTRVYQDSEGLTAEVEERESICRPEIFGAQVAMRRKDGELDVQYYFLTNDNKKYIVDSNVSWWEDYRSKYKILLARSEIAPGMSRSKEALDAIKHALETLVGEEKARKYSISFGSEGEVERLYLDGSSIDSFAIFCGLLYRFLKNSEMGAIDVDWSCTYDEFTYKIIVGSHKPAARIIEDCLEKKNAFKKSLADRGYSTMNLFSKVSPMVRGRIKKIKEWLEIKKKVRLKVKNKSKK